MDSRQAEAHVLGLMLQDNTVYSDTILTTEHFERGDHKAIFETIRELSVKGTEANILTVANECKPVEASYIAGLSSIPLGAAKYYEQIVVDAFKRRRLKTLANRIIDTVETGDAAEIVANAEQELAAIATDSHTDAPRHVSNFLHAYVETLEARHNQHGALPGLSTGLKDIDGMVLGLERRKLYYVGGRPSKGKSAFALQIAKNVAKEVPVGILSLESSSTEILDRLFAQTARIPGQVLRTGMFKPSQFQDITEVAEQLYGLPLYIFDSPNTDLYKLISAARRMVTFQGVRALFVDYLQLINVPGDAPFRDKMATASKALKDLARELDVPVLCAAQLRRDADDRRPHMGDFAESSQIEKDADVAMLLHSEGEGDEERFMVLIEKNRDGATGAVSLHFAKEYVSFHEVVA